MSNETCKPLYLRLRDALTESKQPFAMGFAAGQAEKVYLGACKAAMFRPDAEERELLWHALAVVCEAYGLERRESPVDGELWIFRSANAWLLDRMLEIEPDSSGWHIWRAFMCGIPREEVDPRFHERRETPAGRDCHVGRDRLAGWTMREPRDAFEDAIAQGRLSEQVTAPNYAGRYMYMGTDRDGVDSFKNSVTRRYDI